MLDALISNIQDAIVLIGRDGKVVFESPSASDLLGPRPAGTPRTFTLGRIHPDERAGVVEAFERTCVRPGAVLRGTYRFQRSDGEWRHLEAVAKNLLDDPGLAGVLVTMRDVTERILAVDAAERATSARDVFLSRMSHELKTPLHAIIGWAQLLENDESATTREAADQMLAAGRHLLRLVEDALDLAALREGRISMDIRPCSLMDVLTESIELALPIARARDVRIAPVDHASPSGSVLADPDRLRQVLLNLLSNAIKYNRPGGEVDTGCARNGAERWRVWVRDTGPGIPETHFDRLFERFERLGAERTGAEGTGLGLAIAKQLMEAMGGSIGVESIPGVGSTFWIDLRASASTRAGAAA